MDQALKTISIEAILPNPEQPRSIFDEAGLQALAASIRSEGVIQPIVVEAVGDSFILIDGERRWRASKAAGLKKIPAIIRPAAENQVEGRLAAALAANLQREDMNPIDEARAYGRLHNELGWAKSRIARELGRSLPLIDARLIWLDLETEIQELVATGKLVRDRRVAEALLTVPRSVDRVELAVRMARVNASVKQIQRACAKLAQSVNDSHPPQGDMPPAVHYGVLAADEDPERIDPIFEQLAKRNLLPPWKRVKEAAAHACQACPWHDSPSQTICNDCPAVVLVAGLVTGTPV